MTEPTGIRMPNVAASLIRTWVPIAVGALVTFIASRFDFAISPQTSASVGAFAAMGTAAGYYGIARAFESTRGHGRRDATLRIIGGFMLGGVIPPTYLTDDEYERLRRLDR